jgi:L-alanine-DL-glutamate epimerase-like enolase superfamily enzyme
MRTRKYAAGIHRWTSPACALSALEQCQWDIIGQALNLPVYQLFGGALRLSIRNYANINRSTDPRTPGGFASMAERAIQAGFDAVKLAPWDDLPHDLFRRSQSGEYYAAWHRPGLCRA